MNINIENIPPYKIAYIRKVGPYGTGNVQSMEKLKKWAKTNNFLDNKSIIFGIPHDNPEKTKPENRRYDTCLVISNDYIINDESIKQRNIIGGKYAIFKINHTAEAIKKAWNDIFPTLFAQGYKHDDTRPILERYLIEMINQHYCEICVPVH